MRVFVYEDVTGGGFLNVALPPALAHEGGMMARALLEDLAAVGGVEAFTSRDPQLPPLDLAIECVVAEDDDCFAKCALRADAVWPIAPETGGRLEHLSRRVLALDRILLGSRPHAVRAAASKSQTSQVLRAARIPCVEAFRPDDAPPDGGSWVVKPDDGAGCQNTRLFENRDLALRWARAHPADGLVIQRFIAGPVCSLSLLCGDAGTALLSCNRQHIAVRDGEFQFVEVEVNAIGDRREEFTEMANRIAAAIPGLWGYVGVDLVLTERGAVVLEINPRLTASYAGLSAALNSNVAARVLDLIDGASRPLRRGPTASSAGVAVGTSPG